MKHPLAALFDGAERIEGEIASREAAPHDTSSHEIAAHESASHDSASHEIRTDDPVLRTRRTIDTYHPKRLDLVVSEAVEETPSTRTFRLRRPDGGDLPPFLAGQYVAVYTDGTSRPYAISSSPARLGHYDLTVRRVPGGRISNRLVDSLAVGDPLTTSGPLGTFHHNPLFHGDDLVFLAGGSGVVPAMSMIREIVDRGLARRFHLLYGSRDLGDIVFREELDALAADDPRIRVDHVVQDPDTAWAGPTGLLTAGLIHALAGPLDGRMVYVCGPQALYPYALDQLTALGHPRRRVRFEANGAPADPTRQAHWPAGTDAAEEVSVTARGATFRTRRGRPLLDALEDAGIRTEAACRSGECGLCRLRVVKGAVHNAEEARLRLSDPPAGYTHSCVAYPLTDVELDV
ncbi:FAD-binding oxidoreductase [Streptomyces sp. TLI_105]|uniref:FAD-binding oxidoreductase n=1 Tax=Streptomyces sp. TLI_105 TaxID=1881019 RepID=UPI000897CBCE|nr:FAD-binding oxidoreductase [Streptomyces sp. TLI_105]SEE14379.1 Ferredoxin-NADP reductase [Streptomyces sp. TLI_105]